MTEIYSIPLMISKNTLLSVIICIWVFDIETTFCLIVAHIGHFDSIDKILKHIWLYGSDDSSQNYKKINLVDTKPIFWIIMLC